MDLYHDLALQVVIDLHLTQMVFDIHQLRLTTGDARQLLTALNLVHTLRPSKTPTGPGAAADRHSPQGGAPEDE